MECDQFCLCKSSGSSCLGGVRALNLRTARLPSHRSPDHTALFSLMRRICCRNRRPTSRLVCALCGSWICTGACRDPTTSCSNQGNLKRGFDPSRREHHVVVEEDLDALDVELDLVDREYGCRPPLHFSLMRRICCRNRRRTSRNCATPPHRSPAHTVMQTHLTECIHYLVLESQRYHKNVNLFSTSTS